MDELKASAVEPQGLGVLGSPHQLSRNSWLSSQPLSQTEPRPSHEGRLEQLKELLCPCSTNEILIMQLLWDRAAPPGSLPGEKQQHWWDQRGCGSFTGPCSEPELLLEGRSMENLVLFHILLQAGNLPWVLPLSLSSCHSPSSTTSPTNTLEMPDMAMTTFWDTEVPVMDWMSWDRDRQGQSEPCTL